MEFYDTHFHLKDRSQASQIFEEGRLAGLTKFFLIAGNLADSEEAIEVASTEPDVYATVGIHPHSCREFTGDIGAFERMATHSKCVAIGEIGLDYFYDIATPQEQIPVFSAFLDLAQRCGKPPVIHCREAFEDSLPILREIWTCGRPFEVHSFTGTRDELRQVLDLGAYISFNGMVTFTNADNVRDLLNYVPLDRLLVETDSPYLTPHPYRKYQNSPKYIPVIMQKIAALKMLSLEELATITCRNADLFFGTH